MGSFLEWYPEVPVVTRFYMTSSVLTTAACSRWSFCLRSLSTSTSTLSLMKLQLWRLLTNFFFFGPLGADFLFHMFFPRALLPASRGGFAHASLQIFCSS